MIENVGNTDSSTRPRELLDGAPKTVSKRATASAAPGVSGAAGAGVTPPAAPTYSQSTTISLAPGSAVLPDPATLNASADRYAVAASGGPAASSAPDYSSDLNDQRAMFRVALQANKNEQDDDLANRLQANRIAEAKHRAAANEHMAAADDIEGHKWETLGCACVGAGLTAAGGITSEYKISDYLTFGGKIGDAFAGERTSDGKADEQVSGAKVALLDADADHAKSIGAEANDSYARHLQQLQQIMDTLRDMGDSKAKRGLIA